MYLLINNAGLVIGVDKEFEGSLDEWDIMIDTNIKGLLTMTFFHGDVFKILHGIERGVAV